MRLSTILLISVSFLALAGCAHIGIYRPDVQQGNIYTQAQVAQLRPGMPKAEVQSIMGGPVLVDSFSNNRWHYVYTFQKDGGHILKKSVTVYFRKGRVSGIEHI